MVSWTVDMPTRSAPRVRKARISAGVSNEVPEDGEVDACGELESLAGGLVEGEGAEARRVGGGHIEEALAGAGNHAEARLVGAEGGV